MMRDVIEKARTCEDYALEPGQYGVVTLHRPANVDSREVLTLLCSQLREGSGALPLVSPVHPRTRKNLDRLGLLEPLLSAKDIRLTEPVTYIPFMNLVFNCRVAITYSGGLQEETTYLGIPCIMIRPNTERPITVTQGTNRLCEPGAMTDRLRQALADGKTAQRAPDLWDGRTARRVFSSLLSHLKV